MSQSNNEQNKWYHTQAGVVALLILFFPIGLYLMWKHANWSPKAKWIVTAIVSVFALMVLTSDGSTTQTTSGTVENKQVTEQAEQTVTDNQATKVVEQSKSTQDKLWEALDDGIKKRSGYDIEWNEESGVVTLSKQGETYWDENDAVRGAYADIVKYGREAFKEAFKIDEVKQVQVVHKTEFTDQYGKTEEETAVEIWFDEEEFQKYDWDNLSFQPVSTQMKDSSAYYYVHPAINKALDNSKLYLSI